MNKINVLICAIILCLTAGCVTDKVESGEALGAGDSCPAFSVEMLDGSIFKSTELDGRTTLIGFFNTDCGDCRRELPIIQQAYDKLTEVNGGMHPQFVMISRAQPEASVRSYWNENNLTLPVAPQNDNSIYRMFATIGIPRVFIVNPSGIITAAWDEDPLPSADDIVAAFQ